MRMIGCKMAEDNFSIRTRYRDVQFISIPRLIGGTLSGSVERAMGNLMMRRVPCLAVLCPMQCGRSIFCWLRRPLPTKRSGDSDVLSEDKKERVELL